MDIVTLYTNKVWVEDDILGDAHVMLQSEMPGSSPVCLATVHYNYPHLDNRGRKVLSEQIAEWLGATKPIERRPHHAPLDVLLQRRGAQDDGGEHDE